MSQENQRSGPRAPEELLAAQNLVLEMIALGRPLEDVLRGLASLIDRQEPLGMCLIFLLEPDGCTLRLAVAPKIEGGFTSGSKGKPVGPKHGAFGTAAYRRERVIVADVATDPLYDDYRELVLRYDLRSAWATPILSSDGSALGAMGIYHNRPHIPSEREIDAVERAAYLARIAVERRRLEEQLDAGRERFRALIENTSDVISILDANGVVRYVSPSVERVLGFRPSELIGMPGFDFLHPDELEQFQLRLRRLLGQPGASPAFEQRVRHKNGSWRVIETITNNQLNDPAIAGIVATGRDVTDRKTSEEALIASHDRYLELFENANDIIYTHDLAGKLLSLNRAGERLMGYRREEAVGANLGDFVAPEYKTILREMTDRKIGGEAGTTYEIEIVSKDGACNLLEVSTRLIFQLGRPVAVQGIGRDITERRRLESHLRQSQKMEAIGRLAGGVAHDFNNLLTVITGYSQWMLDEIPRDSPHTENASEILLAAQRAAALTNQLLAFSRNQVIRPIVVDLNSLVAQLDQMLRRLIGEDIELVAALSPDLALTQADPGQIEQVILNLAVNARDAMPEGGKLTIETANVQIDENAARETPDWSPGEYVLLAVSDSGCGIDEKIKPHIFEPFFTTKEVGKGTGLGLSTVYGIVKQGGGYIRVNSTPGAGSVFKIYFPKAASALTPDITPQSRPASGGTETILLVEDEMSVRWIVGEMLVRLGYKVLDVPGAHSALELAREYEKPIHLVLTDIVMPQMGGRQLARQLKSLRGDLKVLFMSGYAGETMLEEDLEQGADYLQKPFPPDALARKIREVLDSG